MSKISCSPTPRGGYGWYYIYVFKSRISALVFAPMVITGSLSIFRTPSPLCSCGLQVGRLQVEVGPNSPLPRAFPRPLSSISRNYHGLVARPAMFVAPLLLAPSKAKFERALSSLSHRICGSSSSGGGRSSGRYSGKSGHGKAFRSYGDPPALHLLHLLRTGMSGHCYCDRGALPVKRNRIDRPWGSVGDAAGTAGAVWPSLRRESLLAATTAVATASSATSAASPATVSSSSRRFVFDVQLFIVLLSCWAVMFLPYGASNTVQYNIARYRAVKYRALQFSSIMAITASQLSVPPLFCRWCACTI